MGVVFAIQNRLFHESGGRLVMVELKVVGNGDIVEIHAR